MAKAHPRIKITKAAEQHTVRVSNCDVSADVPIDGQFHPINPALLSVLENSGVEFEIENADATSGSAAAGGAAKAGGSGRASKRKAKRKSRAKAK